MNRSFREFERGQMGSLRIKDNRDEDLALFREMRKLEKERNDLLLQNNDEFDAPLGLKVGGSQMFNIPSGTSAPVRKAGADDFLNSDNDKNDYEWLLTPPGTPLFPSLEMESQKTIMSHLETPKVRPTALKSRLANSKSEPAARNTLSRQPASASGLNASSNGGLRRPSSAGGSGSRPATPTGRATASSASRPSSTSASNKLTSAAATKSTSNTASKATSTTVSKPYRSATPTSRPMLSSTRSTVTARASTPTTQSTARPSTPPGRSSVPASKSTSRSSTPTRRPTVSNGARLPAVSAKSPVSKPVPTAAKSAPSSRPSSPSVRPKPWKPSDIPGFSLDTPPNLRTTLPDRPISATRGRVGGSSSRSPSVEPVPNGRIRRQSCSPSRGRPSNGIIRSSGSSVPVPAVSRLHAKANDNVSPVVIGTKMVERVINMRKLAPPKQDEKHSPHSNISGKSSSPDSTGFGRTLSKKSLDMAIRHMDIRRTIPGNLRPLMANIPASSMYSVRSGPTKKTASVSDSLVATSSNASSEVSINNNALCSNGPELEDDVCSDKGIQSPPSLHGR